MLSAVEFIEDRTERERNRGKKREWQRRVWKICGNSSFTVGLRRVQADCVAFGGTAGLSSRVADNLFRSSIDGNLSVGVRHR